MNTDFEACHHCRMDALMTLQFRVRFLLGPPSLGKDGIDLKEKKTDCLNLLLTLYMMCWSLN